MIKLMILSLICFCTTLQAQREYTTSASLNKPNSKLQGLEPQPKEVIDLSLYPGTSENNQPLIDVLLTYRYMGTAYFIAPAPHGYSLVPSKKDTSAPALRLEKVNHGNGYLLIDAKGITSYAFFDEKSNLILEFYDSNTKKIEQMKIEPKIKTTD